jgi:MoaA/NifB/PqqE/SkfB family radical SAM enzyme
VDWETATRIVFKLAQNASRRVEGYIKLGYACNNNCLFCTAAWKKRHGDRDVQVVMDEVERIVSEDQVHRMIYSGGEPTVRSELPEILGHAKHLGVHDQNIQTNGRRLSDRNYLELLRSAGLTSCFVSIHGPDAGIHDRLTRSPGAFHQTCAGLANLDRLAMCFVTNTVIVKQNYRVLSEHVSFLAQTFPSVRKIKLTYPRLQGGAADNLSEIIAPLWEVAPFVRAAIESGMKMGVQVETESMPICLLNRKYDVVDNFSGARVNLSDLNYSDSNYYRSSGDIFYEVCDTCDVRSHCYGIDSLHHETFGEHSCFSGVSFADLAQ